MNFFKSTTLLALSALIIAPLTAAHSWIEEYQVIDTNGSYIGDRGYSRGYMARTDPGYNGFSMDYLVPQTGVRINSTDLLCHPAQQTSNYTNTAYPKLQVQPGGYVAMKYLENGHVTLPWNQLGKPETAGTVFVYGTTQPSDTEKMADVLAWSTDGTGGNGKGFLMTAQNFDDGRCHQINCGNISTDRQLLFPAHVEGQPTSSVEQWCETDLKIPASQPVGTLTTYWVWQWPTKANADCTYPDGKDEYYTTCADFDIISGGSGNGDAKIAAEAATNTLVQEAPQSTAVSDFMSRKAYTTSPAVIMVSGTSTIGQSVTATSGFISACSAGQTSRPIVEIPASCAPISVFSGAAYTSAVQAIKAYATTAQITAAAAIASSAPSSTASAIATDVPATSQPSAYISSSMNATSIAPASTPTISAVTPAAVQDTITVTVTVNSLAASTTYAATANANVFSTLSTVVASAVQSSATAPTPSISSMSASSAAPTVGTNGMVEDVVVGTNDRTAHEHVARHALRRHARAFYP
ncbi:hypothetical protein LTR36_005637 [Oleoguttula mirabilis]|uniref:DUF7492 domain-containing protein n=1 Tax=Oleoguttula mirabilis TaxID=1507867 RepID=A0AAV9JDL4_9PEZI|nr:hypothetical protein LTR36_005637 [Oleoguttula mirabilis]